MGAAAPIVFKALTAATAASSAITARGARKDQKQALEVQKDALSKNQQQEERSPTSLFGRRKRSSGGFNDVGAASLTPGKTGTYLGQ